MTRSGVLLCLVICGVVAGCDGSLSSPSGVDLFAQGKVNMTFTPQDQTFAEAAEAYRRLWADEGSKIIEAMERGSGLTFLETHVKAVIFEGPSRSGIGDRSDVLASQLSSRCEEGDARPRTRSSTDCSAHEQAGRPG